MAETRITSRFPPLKYKRSVITWDKMQTDYSMQCTLRQSEKVFIACSTANEYVGTLEKMMHTCLSSSATELLMRRSVHSVSDARNDSFCAMRIHPRLLQ